MSGWEARTVTLLWQLGLRCEEMGGDSRTIKIIEQYSPFCLQGQSIPYLYNGLKRTYHPDHIFKVTGANKNIFQALGMDFPAGTAGSAGTAGTASPAGSTASPAGTAGSPAGTAGSPAGTAGSPGGTGGTGGSSFFDADTTDQFIIGETKCAALWFIKGPVDTNLAKWVGAVLQGYRMLIFLWMYNCVFLCEPVLTAEQIARNKASDSKDPSPPHLKVLKRFFWNTQRDIKRGIVDERGRDTALASVKNELSRLQESIDTVLGSTGRPLFEQGALSLEGHDSIYVSSLQDIIPEVPKSYCARIQKLFKDRWSVKHRSSIDNDTGWAIPNKDSFTSEELKAIAHNKSGEEAKKLVQQGPGSGILRDIRNKAKSGDSAVEGTGENSISSAGVKRKAANSAGVKRKAANNTNSSQLHKEQSELNPLTFYYQNMEQKGFELALSIHQNLPQIPKPEPNVSYLTFQGIKLKLIDYGASMSPFVGSLFSQESESSEMNSLINEANRCFYIHLGIAINVNPFILQVGMRKLAAEQLPVYETLIDSMNSLPGFEPDVATVGAPQILRELLQYTVFVDAQCLQYVWFKELNNYRIILLSNLVISNRSLSRAHVYQADNIQQGEVTDIVLRFTGSHFCLVEMNQTTVQSLLNNMKQASEANSELFHEITIKASRISILP